MTKDQANIIRTHIQGLRGAIDGRHRDALEAYTLEIAAHDRYAAMLLQDAPVVEVTPRPFPDERHLYRGSLETMRGVGYRPRRWRGGGGGEVEYAYKTGGKLRAMAALSLGTVGTRGVRWVTVTELNRCRAYDHTLGRRS